MNILEKRDFDDKSRATYAVGRIQAKAYGILMRHTTEALASYGITPKEWALLGLMYERGQLRPSSVAHELGVEAGYVTTMGLHLKKMGLLDEERNEIDSRAKILALTKSGTDFVKKHEPVLRQHMRPLLVGAQNQDVLGYLALLEIIIKNEEKLKH